MSWDRVRRNQTTDLSTTNPSNVFFIALANFRVAFGRLFSDSNRSPRISRQSSRDRVMMQSSFQSSTTTSGISSSHGIISAQNGFLESGNSSQISSPESLTMSNLSIDERQIQGNMNYYKNHKLAPATSHQHHHMAKTMQTPMNVEYRADKKANLLQRNSTLKANPSERTNAVSNETLKNYKSSIDYNGFFPLVDKDLLQYVLSKNPRLAVDCLQKRKRTMRSSIIQLSSPLFTEKKRPPRLKSLKGINSSKSTDTDYFLAKPELEKIINSQVSIPTFFNENFDEADKLTRTIEAINDVSESNNTTTTSLVNHLPMKFEFNIPFSDIKFDKKIKSGFKKNIYRGFWHGDVIVHEYYDLSKSQINRFWTEVEAMTFISHENISLFMGASMEPPHFAVVMSLVNGASLYECLHLIQKKFSSTERLDIIRPILQAISYLHAKGKVVKRLNSRNIYLTPRVTLSLLDFSETFYELEFYLSSPMSIVSNFSYVSLNQSAPKQVTSPLYTFNDEHYSPPKMISPNLKSSQYFYSNQNVTDDESFEEIESSANDSPPEFNLSNYQSRRSSFSSQENSRPIKSLDPRTIDYYKFFQSKIPKVIEEIFLNRQTDIFALGTILFELCTNEYPFEGLPIPELVIRVCSKERQSLVDLKMNSKIKNIIEVCWSHDPGKRPPAEVLCRELLSIQSSIKKRSTSQPEDLNQIHLSLEYDM